MGVIRKVLLALVGLLVVLGLAITSSASATSPKVPVIILFAPTAGADAQRQVIAAAGGEVSNSFTIVNAVAASVPVGRILDLWSNPLVVSVDPDAEVTAADSSADAQIKADQVWALGFTGSGVKLAILDTGIATAHPEFTGRIVACRTEVKRTRTCEDDNGHGTHVAGLAGASGSNAAAKGAAPSVSLMSDKVLNSAGSGSLSQVIAGINWAVANGAKIISMSLGTSPADGGGTQPNCDGAFPSLTTAVNNAVASGVTVVAAAGNAGTSGLGAPGCISSVIAVGAVDSSDSVAGFSSRGAALKDHGIVAPGVSLFSSWLNGGYATLSGTSMATPMVSGTVALMLSKNSGLTPSTIRSTLFTTADCVLTPCPNNDVGKGRVNALSAVNAVPLGGFGFSVAVNPTSSSRAPGGSSAPTVTATLSSGTTQAVSLSSAISPATSTITRTFSPTNGNPTFTSTLTQQSTTSTLRGTYSIAVTLIIGDED